MQRVKVITIVTILFVNCLPSPLWAASPDDKVKEAVEVRDGKPANLPELIRAANGSVRRLTEDDVSAAKEELIADLNALENFLAKGTRENLQAWKRYLHWEAMQGELSKEEAPSLEVLNKSLATFREDHTGLEMSYFTDVRQSLREYMNQVLFASNDRLEETFEQKVEQLAGLVEKYGREPSTSDALAIGRTLGWFERSGQIESVVDAVRARYSRPNLFVAASERLVGAGLKDSLDETEGFRESILGTSVHGTTRLIGDLDLVLVPDSERAAMDVVLKGDATSSNTGYNRGVTIRSTGQTSVNASKRIYIDASGLSSDPASATASTSTHVSSVSHRLALVRKIAWRQVGRQKQQAERIASRKAASRVAGRVDDETGELLAKTNRSLDEKVFDPLVRRESFPKLIKFRTTDSRLVFKLLHATRFQMAAPGAAPKSNGDFDLAVRLHESVVGNFAESILGGLTLTNDKLVELLERASAEIPEELRTTDEEPPWSITFARERPVTVDFQKEKVRFVIRGRRLTRGDSEVRAPVEISATYGFEKHNNGAKLTRKGELSVEYVGRERLSTQEVALKSILQKKFAAMFKPEFASEGLTLPGRWQRAGKLRLRELVSGADWLTLGWKQPPEGLRTASNPDDAD